LADGIFFKNCFVFCKYILTKLVGHLQHLLVFVSGWNSLLQPFRFHENCFHFLTAVFVHVGLAQLSTGNVISFHMCNAVETAWLAQIIRHSGQVCDCF